MADTNTFTLDITAAITKILDSANMPLAANAAARTLKQSFAYSKPSDAPTLDKLIVYQHVQAAADDTLDLTNVTAYEGSDSGDMTGLKVFGIFLYPVSTNTGNTTVGPGASNPYLLFGTSNSIVVPKGAKMLLYDNAVSLAAVSASVKTIKISGTVADKLNLGLLLT